MVQLMVALVAFTAVALTAEMIGAAPVVKVKSPDAARLPCASVEST